jgi:chaperonin GroES
MSSFFASSWQERLSCLSASLAATPFLITSSGISSLPAQLLHITHASLIRALPTLKGVSSMKIKPLGDRVVIKRFEADEKTAGGILLPDSARNKPQKGKVLSVGPGKLNKDGKYQPLDVKEGDTVLFTNWAGDEFKEAEGENILLMRVDDILAIIS